MDIANKWANGEDAVQTKRPRSPEEDRPRHNNQQRRRYCNFSEYDVLTRWRLVLEVVAPQETSTAAAGIGMTNETRLVLASRIIGLDLREILMYHQTSF